MKDTRLSLWEDPSLGLERMSSGTGSLEGKEIIKEKGLSSKMAGLRGLPSVAMIVGGLQEEGTREKPFTEVSVFQSMGKERKKRRREEVGMKE